MMGMPGMEHATGMPGMGGPADGMTKMRTLTTAEKNAKKKARQREKKDARKKSAPLASLVVDARVSSSPARGQAARAVASRRPIGAPPILYDRSARPMKQDEGKLGDQRRSCSARRSSVGCVGGSKGLSSEDKEKLKAYVLDAPPADMPHKLDINYENKVHLIGYKFDPETAKPGQSVKLTYYWRCDDTVEDGWMLFTHTKDDGNGKMGNLDYDGPLRDMRNGGHQVLGPERWEKGKFYVDEQPYQVPDDAQGPTITVMVGVWKNDARLRIVEVARTTAADNSGIVGKIKTGTQPPSEEHAKADDVPVALARPEAREERRHQDRRQGRPGRMGRGREHRPFRVVSSARVSPNPGFPAQGSVKLAWDDQNLYVLATVVEAEFYTGFTDAKSQPNDFTAAGQPKLWTKDALEMMLEPDPAGTNTNYYELQINPQNKVFKSQFDTLQQPAARNGFGHEELGPQAEERRHRSRRTAAARPPATRSRRPSPGLATPRPEPFRRSPARVWRLNFYAMKNNAGMAWSPIRGQGNFHNAKRFGKVTWTVPGAPAADAPGAGSAAAAGSAAPGDSAEAAASGRPMPADARPPHDGAAPDHAALASCPGWPPVGRPAATIRPRAWGRALRLSAWASLRWPARSGRRSLLASGPAMAQRRSVAPAPPRRGRPAVDDAAEAAAGHGSVRDPRAHAHAQRRLRRRARRVRPGRLALDRPDLAA